MRVWIGVDVEVRSESHDGVHLEGRPRLAPGRVVEIARTRPGGPEIRKAVVDRWLLLRMGRTGPVYHGFCAWT